MVVQTRLSSSSRQDDSLGNHNGGDCDDAMKADEDAMKADEEAQQDEDEDDMEENNATHDEDDDDGEEKEEEEQQQQPEVEKNDELYQNLYDLIDYHTEKIMSLDDKCSTEKSWEAAKVSSV